ncbi:MAG: hypothetical protein U0R18_05165 [Mycobacterium sp.]
MNTRDRQIDIVMSSTEDELRQLRGRLFDRFGEPNDDGQLLGDGPSTEDEPNEQQEQDDLTDLRQRLFGDTPIKD